MLIDRSPLDLKRSEIAEDFIGRRIVPYAILILNYLAIQENGERFTLFTSSDNTRLIEKSVRLVD